MNAYGKPLAGIVVFNTGDAPKAIPTRTDAAGRFRLDGLRSGPVYVFAAKPDYRFTALRTASGASGVVLKLLRRDEPVPPWPRPAPPSRREELEVARRCLDRLWEVVNPAYRIEPVIEIMARIDLDQARKWSLESDGRGRAEVERALIKTTADKDLDKAISLLGGADKDVNRWNVLAALVRRYAISNRVKAMRCAEELASLARKSEGLPERIKRLARAGDMAMQLGPNHQGTGRRWIEEAAGLLPKLVKRSEAHDYDYDNAYWEVAHATASYDLGRAILLLSQLGNPASLCRCSCDLAVAGCLIDLDRSLQIVKDIPRDEHMVFQEADITRARIACRLAAAKPELAIELVEQIPSDSSYRAQAFGGLAVAVAPHDKALAWSLMDRALPTGVETVATGFESQATEPEEAATLAVRALQIGYPDLQGAIWRVLTRRPATDFFDYGAGSLERVAEILALADPETAKEILQSVERRSELLGFRSTRSLDHGHRLSAWALVDLKHAEQLFDRQLVDIGNIDDPSVRATRLSAFVAAAEAMADVLATPPSERLERLTPRFYEEYAEEDD